MWRQLLLPAVFLGCLQASHLRGQAILRFGSRALELRSGDSAMVALLLDQPAEHRTTPLIEVSDNGVLEVIREAEILPGKKTGFLRVRALAAGQSQLSVAGETLEITVEDEPLVALIERMRPELTAPAAGAAIWGKASIGAEIWIGAPGVNRDTAPDACLLLPNGKKLAPAEVMPPVDGPFWRLIFEVDCSTLDPGIHDFHVDYAPRIRGLDPERRLLSQPHSLVILAAPGNDDWMISGECENTLNTPRSDRLGPDPPGVGFDRNASKARFVNLYGQRPEWVFEADIPSESHYQLVLRTRGTLAASAYPSLEFLHAEDGRRLTAGRLVGSHWQRLAIGAPVQLEAGKQILGVRLANDINYRGRVKRDAFADRFELRQVPAFATGDQSSMNSMMAGATMSMMARNAASQPDNNKTSAVPERLRVEFARIFDGDSVNGPVKIRTFAKAANYKRDPDYEKILTSLLVNRRPLDTRRGRYPSFQVYPHDLKPGRNSLQLVSMGPGGSEAESPEQTLVLDATTPPLEPLPTAYQEDRFDLRRGKWRPHKPLPVIKQGPYSAEDAPGSLVLLKGGDEALVHRLPDHLNGRYRLSLLLHLPQGEGLTPGKLELALVARSGKKGTPDYEEIIERHFDSLEATEQGWNLVPTEPVNLPKGRREVEIRVAGGNPAHAMAIAGVSIGTPYFVDQSPPEQRVAYPLPGALVHPQGDAVLVEGFDDGGLSHHQIWVDGQKQALDLPPADTGPTILPWDTSILAPGPHRLKVVAVDLAGNQTESEEITFEIVSQLDPDRLTLPYPRAVRLAERLGYGADRRTLATILTEGEEAWIDQQIAAGPDAPGEALVRKLSQAQFQNLGHQEVRGRVVASALHTRYPLRARFVLWAENHFSVWMQKAGSQSKWTEHEGFRGAGMPRFNDLLLLSATSPAMMVYLDQQNSLGKQLNENYAREILELHTVGVDAGYSQEDVTSLAHLLTGWGAQKEATMDGTDYLFRYRFSPFLNEEAPREIFGLSLAESDFSPTSDDRILQFLEMLACRPETAHFISRKLLRHYFADEPPERLLEAVEQRFRETQGDFRKLIRLIATSPELMARDLHPKILQPVEFAIANQRVTESFHPWRVLDLADRSGRNLFDRSTPDGYPEENEAYANSNFQLQKWRFAKDLAEKFDKQLPWKWFDENSMKSTEHRAALARLVTLLLTRHPISSSSAAAAETIAIQASEVLDQQQRRRMFAAFTLMLPEPQFR